MKNRLLYFIVLSLLCATNIYASIKGQIFSSETKQPIGYVSVGSSSRSFGMVADSLGRFMFNVTPRLNDSLVISSIGYEPTVVSLSELRDSVFLTPCQQRLSEIVVTPRKKKKIGNVYGKSGLGYVVIYTDDKQEVGRVFDISKNCIVRNVRLNVFTPQEVRLRLNVYGNVDGKWESVLNKNVFWPSLAKNNDDYSSHVYELVLEEPLVLEKGEYLISVEDVSNST